MKILTTLALLTFIVVCESFLGETLGRSIGENVPLLHSKLEGFSKELGKGNFDDIDMEERYVFKDQDDFLEYIRELQRRYALLVGRPRSFSRCDLICLVLKTLAP